MQRFVRNQMMRKCILLQQMSSQDHVHESSMWACGTSDKKGASAMILTCSFPEVLPYREVLLWKRSEDSLRKVLVQCPDWEEEDEEFGYSFCFMSVILSTKRYNRCNLVDATKNFPSKQCWSQHFELSIEAHLLQYYTPLFWLCYMVSRRCS